MSDRDHELLEAELRKLAPARPPAELMARLSEVPRMQEAAVARHSEPSAVPQPSTFNPQPFWRLLVRWLAPLGVTAAIVAALMVLWPHAQRPEQHVKPAAASTHTPPKPDEVEIDRQLVALFDAVAQLPNGEPVRFRCREWRDDVVVRDPGRGLVIERSTPRLEVVPISVETF